MPGADRRAVRDGVCFRSALRLEQWRDDHRARDRAGGAVRAAQLRRAPGPTRASGLYRQGGRAGRIYARSRRQLAPRCRAVVAGVGRGRGADRVSPRNSLIWGAGGLPGNLILVIEGPCGAELIPTVLHYLMRIITITISLWILPYDRDADLEGELRLWHTAR